MPRRRWQQIEFRLSPPYQDLLTGQLALLPFKGFVQEDNRLIGTVEGSRWTAAFRKQLDGVLKRFRAEFPEVRIHFSTSVLSDQNWNRRWEETAGVVEVNDRIIIKPSWKKLRKRDKGKLVLQIDPKMSFGTGHHETTRLCLILLERYLQKGMKVLDVGSGTGVLAIAAARMGAAKAVAIDHDPWAVRNAKENVARNRVRRKVSIRRGNAATVGINKADLIISNIDLQTNIKLLPALTRRLARAGVLILSGLLVSDLGLLMDALENRNVIPIECVAENEWAAVALARADANQRY